MNKTARLALPLMFCSGLYWAAAKRKTRKLVIFRSNSRKMQKL